MLTISVLAVRECTVKLEAAGVGSSVMLYGCGRGDNRLLAMGLRGDSSRGEPMRELDAEDSRDEPSSLCIDVGGLINERTASITLFKAIDEIRF